MTLLNVGCGTHYADGWVNVDVVANDSTHPDLVVPRDAPLPFPDGSCVRIYLGHVLEHVRWDRVLGFLADVRRLLVDGGELLVTGPDVRRTLNLWKLNQVDDALMHSVMEHAEVPTDTDWPEASHQWNCHEARVHRLLEVSGFANIEPRDIYAMARDGSPWPVVCPTDWQLCLLARQGLP